MYVSQIFSGNYNWGIKNNKYINKIYIYISLSIRLSVWRDCLLLALKFETQNL